MSPEQDDERSARQIENEMEDEAARMQRRVDELGELAQDADKKADVSRQHAAPDEPGEPLGAVGDDQADEDSTDDAAGRAGDDRN